MIQRFRVPPPFPRRVAGVWVPRFRASEPVPIGGPGHADSGSGTDGGHPFDSRSGVPMARKRCRRYDEVGHAHELTFSCDRRLPLLSRDRTRHWLIEAIQAARGRTRFDLWAYVIMPEHAQAG